MQVQDLVSTTSPGKIYQWTFQFLDTIGLTEQLTHGLTAIILLLAVALLLITVHRLFTKLLRKTFIRLIRRTKTNWDDYLIHNKVIHSFTRLLLVILAQQLVPQLFVGFDSFRSIVIQGLSIVVLLVTYQLVNGLLRTGRDILRKHRSFVDKPLDSYLQVIQIFLIFIIFTITFSIITGNSPWKFLVSLGAASAILMLVFKDTILGFVASIQVSANDSVRVGDWIEMSKYGADGSVIEINLNNVKVQNFDKTIVTLPTYALLSDSFKNYRGMQHSGGRRIKRAIRIKISSIRYLTVSEIEELKKIQLLRSYIEEREQEINSYNERTGADKTMLVNGRHMTNAGLFRAYATAYAKSNARINQQMTLMVRQLEPTEHGLPIELYMFTKGVDWIFYESTMADLFDHLFSAIKSFHLEVFELPASDDLRSILKNKTL